MKTLYIVRHAKSSWDHPNLQDHDRPLLKKGEKRTLKIAKFLKEKKIKPNLIISSTAVRAYETAVIIAEQLNYPVKDIVKESIFYHADKSILLDYLFGLDDSINSVMVFGHNPGFTNFANIFLNETIDNLPTSAVVCIKFVTQNWKKIMLVKRKTNFVIYPKML